MEQKVWPGMAGCPVELRRNPKCHCGGDGDCCDFGVLGLGKRAGAEEGLARRRKDHRRHVRRHPASPSLSASMC